jgi:hypothetical protein
MKRNGIVLGLAIIVGSLAFSATSQAEYDDHFGNRRALLARQQQEPIVVRRPWGGPTTGRNWWTPVCVSPGHPHRCGCQRRYFGYPYVQGVRQHNVYLYNYYNNYYIGPYNYFYVRPW